MKLATDQLAADAITSTILIALANARGRGDPWKTFTEQHLAWSEALLERIRKMAMKTLTEFSVAAANVELMERKVLLGFEQLADAIWEMREQDTQDPLVAILSPGTQSYFFEWPVGHAGDRVEAVVEFLEPLLAEQGHDDAALAEVRPLLPEYRAACEKVRALRSKLEILDRMTDSIARRGHVQYSRLRRRMRAEGFDAFDIRSVLPDIPGGSMTGTLG